MPEQRAARQYVPPEAFVRSYDPPADVDPWTFVQRYREAISLRRDDPDRSIRSIAERVGLPRDRLEQWLQSDGEAPPRVVRQLSVAHSRGWINVEPTTEMFRGLNVLVGSAFDPGTIDPDSYEPRFRVHTTDDIERVAWAIDRVGLRYAMVRDSESEAAREVRPTDDGEVLGRVLVGLGAPVGEDGATGRLPPYLGDVGREHRLAFARTLLATHQRPATVGSEVRLTVEGSERFREAVAEFLGDVGGVTVPREGPEVVLPADAARSLGVPP